MYVYKNHFKGFFKLLLRLSKLTYYNLFSFMFCLDHVGYMLYMSVLKTMYYVHVWNKMFSVLFCSANVATVWCLTDDCVHVMFYVIPTCLIGKISQNKA